MKKLQKISLLFLVIFPCTYFPMNKENKALKKFLYQEKTFEQTFGYTLSQNNSEEDDDEYLHDYAYCYAKRISENKNDPGIDLDEYLAAYDYKKNFLRQESSNKKKPMPQLEPITPIQNTITPQLNKTEPSSTNITPTISKSKKKRLRKKQQQANKQTITMENKQTVTISFSIPITPPDENKKNTEEKKQIKQQKKEAKIQQSLRQYDAHKKKEVIKYLCNRFHVRAFNMPLLREKLCESSEFLCSPIIGERYDESCTWQYNAIENVLEIFTDDYER